MVSVTKNERQNIEMNENIRSKYSYPSRCVKIIINNANRNFYFSNSRQLSTRVNNNQIITKTQVKELFFHKFRKILFERRYH